jgi:GNAT superfamily N-acetyltransferase
MAEPSIRLRPAADADADFVLRVTEACMRRYVEQTWGRWDAELTRSQFSAATHRIVECGGRDIGCIQLTETAEGLHLQRLFLLPEHQNRGIGTRLMRDILERARAAGKPVRLRVLAVNPARRFYERLGFAVRRSTAERHEMEWTPRDGGESR